MPTLNNPESANESGPRMLPATGMSPLPSMFEGLRFPSIQDFPARRENRLPHLELSGCPIFVTFRLADSIPVESMQALKAEEDMWLAEHPVPWSVEEEVDYHKQFSRRIFDWMDEGMGSCRLRDASSHDTLRTVLGRFENVRYRSFAWVVMPNHVHGLFALLGKTSLDGQLKSWKGVSAREILRGTDENRLWQKDYFDRIVRNEAHFWRVARYIRRNPEKAWLPDGDFSLWEHPEVQQRLDALDRSGDILVAGSEAIKGTARVSKGHHGHA